MRKNEDDRTATLIRTIGTVLVGGIISLGICMMMLLLCSIGISSGLLNNRAMVQYTVGSCIICSFLGAMYSVYRVRSRTLFVGVLTSCVLFLLIISIGFLMFPETSLSDHGAEIAAGCFAGGILAGFLGGKPKKKRRK